MAQGYIKTINYKSFWKLGSFLAEFLSCHLHLKNVSLNLILHAKIVSFFKMTRKFTSNSLITLKKFTILANQKHQYFVLEIHYSTKWENLPVCHDFLYYY